MSDFLYYADEAIDFSLLVSVILELFFYTVSPVTAWLAGTRKYLISGLTAGISFAGLLVMSLGHPGSTRSEMWDDRIDILTSLLLCTFLLISAWTTIRLGVQRSSKVIAVGRGMVIWASIALIVDLSHMNAMWAKSTVFDEVSDSSWVFMISFWAYSLWRPDKSTGWRSYYPVKQRRAENE